jgi:dTDP-4-amino-4,6-dideoxygalactose transaminase
VNTPIFLSPPDTGDAEQQAVARAVASGWAAPIGPELDQFERELAMRVGVDHGVAVSSGTAALHLALLGVGARAGTRVITSTFTFAATANAIAYTGAEPVLVDCDPVTGNLDSDLVEGALAESQASGPSVAAVLAVDIYGKSADYSTLDAITKNYGVPLLADGAESLGAFHKGAPVGSLGRATAVSFNGNKIMTTSGGGMLLTDDAVLAAEARKRAAQSREPTDHYEHHEVGYNYRLSNVLAALGRAQLVRLDDMIARRRANREFYRKVVADFDGVSLLHADDDESDNCWLTSIVIDPALGIAPGAVRSHLAKKGIESRRLWKPLHRQLAFSTAHSIQSGAADALFATGLSLPSGSQLVPTQLDRIADSLHSVLGNARA